MKSSVYLKIRYVGNMIIASNSGIEMDFQPAVEEGIVVVVGCTLLRLASRVDAIKESLDNDEEKVFFFLLHFYVGVGVYHITPSEHVFS